MLKSLILAIDAAYLVQNAGLKQKDWVHVKSPRFSFDVYYFLSRKRMEQATKALGPTAVTRVISLTLYFLGANLKELAAFIEVPLDTIKTLARRTLRDGLPVLEDRRRKTSDFRPINKTSCC